MGNWFSKTIFLFKTRFLKPALYRLHKRTRADLQEGSLDSLNFERRQALVRHAFEHSSFYRDKYAGLVSGNGRMQNSDDFLLLPPLTRAELRQQFENIKANHVPPNRVRKATTSGSTDAPISILHDRRHPETPIRWRILSWWGVQPWENQAFIYRYERPLRKRVQNSILWWPTRRIFLAAANLDSKKLSKFINDFNRIKPALLQGYVDVVFEFALYLLDNNIKVHPPKMVWVTSAPLCEEQRELMEKAFGAPVCDQYGNTEILLIAAECPEKNGLHIMQDTVYIEFVDDNYKPVPPNTTGKILLTDLTNYAFPIIRYEIGDEGKYLDNSCPCGCPLPMMENVRGRQSMIIQTPSGLRIKGEHIMAMFDGHMNVFKEIQLRQEADFSVCIDYVPRELHMGHENAVLMAHLLKKRSRSEIEVQYRETDRIKQVGQKKPLIISQLG